MAAHYGTDARQDRSGRGALVTAALVGAVFGGLSVIVITNAVGSGATVGISGSALVGLAGLLLLMVGLNVWARRDARRQGREAQELIAQGFAGTDQARRRATELQSRLERHREGEAVAGPERPR